MSCLVKAGAHGCQGEAPGREQQRRVAEHERVYGGVRGAARLFKRVGAQRLQLCVQDAALPLALLQVLAATWSCSRLAPTCTAAPLPSICTAVIPR
jgi:hypothetical protein